MSNLPLLPLTFDEVDVIVNPTLHLSFDFDLITSIVLNEGNSLNVTQRKPINALEISIAGRTSNPNISLAMDAATRLFTLNSLYLMDLVPYVKESTSTSKNPPLNKKCFVIEGYSIQNNNNEKILICLPMNPTTNPKNLFYPLENAIVNENNNIQINLNLFIPKIDIETDYYNYYTHSDEAGCLFHVVFFANSYLGYSDVLTFPTNQEYTSPQGTTVYKSNMLALQHPKMTDSFEDNIYIDCVPVDIVNREEEKYMQTSITNSAYFHHMMVLFTYLIALILIVYGIYYFYIFMTKPAKTSLVSRV